MKKSIFLMSLGLVVLTTDVFAGILYLEVPEGITAEMVRSPLVGDEVIIEEFVISEVNKVDKGWADRVVWLTKDGKPLLREPSTTTEETVTADETNGGRFGFGDIYLIRGADWSDIQWKDIEGHFANAYPLAKKYFAPPVVPSGETERGVEVIRYQYLENDWGFYDLANDRIYLKQWRLIGEPVEVDTDKAMLTRCMLHAFRGGAPCTWDQFGAGIVHSAWLEIQRILAEDYGKETNFNDLYHDEKLLMNFC